MSEPHSIAPGQDRQEESSSSEDVAAALATDRRELHRSLGAGVLAIAGLSSLAFAQPIYDLLRRAPEFFAIRNLYMGDLLALVVVLALAPTLVLSAPAIAARFLRPSWTRSAVAVPVGLLAALIALQAVLALPAAAAIGMTLAVGSTTAWGYVRFRGVRSFALILSLAALVVPALLVLDGRVRQSATAPSQAVPALPDSGARAPIVLVIFDEWSLTSILDSEGAIDRERLPNLARLADRATWYPNATAASDGTQLSVSAILTGQTPERGRLPTTAEHPVNLFTTLAPSHDLFVVEPITSLCPPDLNLLAQHRPAFRKRFHLLVADLAVVWLNLTLPTIWTEQLPEITHTWSGFGQDRAPAEPIDPSNPAGQRAFLHLRDAERAAEFRRFTDSIRPPDQRPGFYFLHSLLPHRPWEYLPSGRAYPRFSRNRIHGLEREVWTPDPWPVRHHQKRYLLQVQFVDLLIGELIEKLESRNLFDQSVVVITADHGLAFEPGSRRRFLSRKTGRDLAEVGEKASRRNLHQALDFAAVPLIIKAPFQRQAEIDDNATSLVGLAPRILEVAGAAATAIPRFEDTETPTMVGWAAGPVELPIDRQPWRRERVAEQSAMLGETNDPMAIGIAPALHGLRLSDLPRRSSEIGIRLETPDRWDHVDPQAALLPAVVQGTLTGSESLHERSVAVALNGVIAASVRPYQTSDGRIRIAAMLPEHLFRPGYNELGVYLISDQGGVSTLEHVNRPPRYVYELAWNEPGRPVLLRRRRGGIETEADKIPVVREAGGVIGYLEDGHRSNAGLRGWATDIADPGGVAEVVAFLGESQFWAGTPTSNRQNVADRHGPEHLYSGFSSTARTRPKRGAAAASEILRKIRREGFVAYAVSRRGTASRLRFFYTPLDEEAGTEVVPISDGRRLPVLQTGGRFEGAVDLVSKPGKRTFIEGWAADLERGERPRQIVVYRDGKFLVALGTNRKRPDVAEHYDDPRLLQTGFRGTVPGAPEPANFAERHRVFALMLAGYAVELPIRTAPGTASKGPPS